jgi:hypothetical protein
MFTRSEVSQPGSSWWSERARQVHLFPEVWFYSPRTLQEASFWIVDVVINEIMPPDYYSYAMCYASASVHFQHLLPSSCPLSLVAHGCQRRVLTASRHAVLCGAGRRLWGPMLTRGCLRPCSGSTFPTSSRCSTSWRWVLFFPMQSSLIRRTVVAGVFPWWCRRWTCGALRAKPLCVGGAPHEQPVRRWKPRAPGLLDSRC